MHLECTTKETSLIVANELDGDGDLEFKTLYNDEVVPVYVNKAAVRYLMNHLLFILEKAEEEVT